VGTPSTAVNTKKQPEECGVGGTPTTGENAPKVYGTPSGVVK